ncbi:MAG: hypothetical protein HOG79_14645 [Prolixibacteraceae bacterium]|jgi:hypothetical protein|nr:hypothetical protein [Prolixibacteraceae bacterium]
MTLAIQERLEAFTKKYINSDKNEIEHLDKGGRTTLDSLFLDFGYERLEKPNRLGKFNETGSVDIVIPFNLQNFKQGYSHVKLESLAEYEDFTKSYEKAIKTQSNLLSGIVWGGILGYLASVVSVINIGLTNPEFLENYGILSMLGVTSVSASIGGIMGIPFDSKIKAAKNELKTTYGGKISTGKNALYNAFGIE